MNCVFDYISFNNDTFDVCVPIPPTPIIKIVEERRWPGPPITLYRETDIIPAWQRQREDEEILIL